MDPLLKILTDTPVSNVRNFSILAHIDAGKTTISDHLLAANGLLSNHLAGQVRYLDSRPDEQERLITMKASSVALLHKLDQKRIDIFEEQDKAVDEAFEKAEAAEAEAAAAASDAAGTVDPGPQQEQSQQQQRVARVAADALLHPKAKVHPGSYVCNLLDCPGHIDFSSEVAAAVRLSDGAVIVVDLVDGVTMVTRSMLRQCYLEGLPMVLLLNKLDAIILRMKLTPEEGFNRMAMAVQECNAFLASCVAAEDIAAAGAVAVAGDDDDDDNNINNQGEEEDSDDEVVDDDDDDAAAASSSMMKTSAAAARTTTTTTTKTVRVRALEAPADEVWFCPTKGNVIFGSGLHGFGFPLYDFAALYKSKLPKVPTHELTRGMWGQHYLEAKTMSVVSHTKKVDASPLGVTLFCEPLWALHSAFEVEELDEEKIRGMLTKLGLSPKPGFFNVSSQAKHAASLRFGAEGVNLPLLFQFLGEWKPLAKAVLDTICCRLPCPQESQRRRAQILLPSLIDHDFFGSASTVQEESATATTTAEQAHRQAQKKMNQAAVQALSACDRSESAPLYAFVAKLFDVQYLAGVLPAIGAATAVAQANTASASIVAPSGATAASEAAQSAGMGILDLDDHFVALTRVYSGRVAPGMTVCIDSAGTAAGGSSAAPKACEIQDVYILRGQGLERVPFVAAGNICGIRGCSKSIVKCATMCDPLFEEQKTDQQQGQNDDDTAVVRIVKNKLPFMAPIRLLSSSVVQLAVTPEVPDELSCLLRGLKLLHQTDPQVELAVLPGGDHVIRCAGEVHAERCIEDLRTTFARVNLRVSEPIVGLRETVSKVASLQPVTIALGNNVSIDLAAVSLPSDILDMLLTNATEDSGSSPQTAKKVVKKMRDRKLLDRRKSVWKKLFRGTKKQKTEHSFHPPTIVAWGPQKMHFCGNLLIDTTGTFPNFDAEDGAFVVDGILEAIISGFELGVSRGPMTNEPMFGIAFVIVGASNIVAPASSSSILTADNAYNAGAASAAASSVSEQQQQQQQQQQHYQQPAGVFTGHIVSTVATGMRQAFAAHANSQRIVEPVYECIIFSAGQTRGKIYGLLNRRRATIVDEVLQEGSDMFCIRSLLPATESFGLQDALRTETSGAATAQLQMDRWEILDVDPYYKPTTREELEEQGTNIDKPNLAQTIIDNVRKRKGLYRQQVVKHAEKQKFSIRGG